MQMQKKICSTNIKQLIEKPLCCLASMWDKWATQESIKIAGKKVGITNESLNIAFMQNYKFQQASIQAEEVKKNSSMIETPQQQTTLCLLAASPNVTDISTILNSKLSSPISIKRKDSQIYWREKASNWKDKCLSLQAMITDLDEKSINLNDIPGLLTIQKAKSTQSIIMHKETTRVTQVHGSMQSQDVLKLVESINNSKEKKVQDKEDRERK
nr:uncharacterized protein LOC100212312 [Hydra vulgaris]